MRTQAHSLSAGDKSGQSMCHATTHENDNDSDNDAAHDVAHVDDDVNHRLYDEWRTKSVEDGKTTSKLVVVSMTVLLDSGRFLSGIERE